VTVTEVGSAALTTPSSAQRPPVHGIGNHRLLHFPKELRNLISSQMWLRLRRILSIRGSNHGSTGNDVARWLFYLMWLSLSYLIFRSLSLSLFNVARTLFYLLGYLDISIFDVSPMGACKYCKMSKCNCRGFDPSCRYGPPYRQRPTQKAVRSAGAQTGFPHGGRNSTEEITRGNRDSTP